MSENDLRELTKQRTVFWDILFSQQILKFLIFTGFIDEMIRTVSPTNGWKVLILDHDSTRIISAACRMYDIMEEGVTCNYPNVLF